MLVIGTLVGWLVLFGCGELMGLFETPNLRLEPEERAAYAVWPVSSLALALYLNVFVAIPTVLVAQKLRSRHILATFLLAATLSLVHSWILTFGVSTQMELGVPGSDEWRFFALFAVIFGVPAWIMAAVDYSVWSRARTAHVT